MNGFRFLRRPSNDGRPEHTKVESSKRLSGTENIGFNDVQGVPLKR